MTPEQAEIFALNVLSWIATEEETFEGFLGHAGASRDDIRENASNPLFLGALLDFVLMSDESILRFSAYNDTHPEQVAAARSSLPGGQALHWT